MENAEATAAKLLEIKALGIQLGIDDFGTGYSSLSYLHRFPVDILKVDRSFVSAMDSHENLQIVHTITMLSQNLGMRAVAEGVETAEQAAQLRAMNCQYAQGYFSPSRLMPVQWNTYSLIIISRLLKILRRYR